MKIKLFFNFNKAWEWIYIRIAYKSRTTKRNIKFANDIAENNLSLELSVHIEVNWKIWNDNRRR